MKKIALLLMFCLVFTSLALFVSAIEDEDIGIYEGAEYVKGELLVWSTEFFDPAEFEGDGPFDFLGISITYLELLVSSEITGGDVECYYIKIADGIDTLEALEILGENENVSEVSLNYIAYPDDDENKEPETDKEELEAFEGRAFLKGELLVWSTEFFDPAEFEGEGPFDFLGISITDLVVLVSPDITGSDVECYYIKIADGVDTLEALEILSENENVTEVSLNHIEYPDIEWVNVYIDDSPFVGMNKVELAEHYLFVSDEFTLCLNEELDLAEFEGEGPNYLYGVCVETISRVESEDEDSFVYNIKLGKQYMWNCDALTVFECNDNVISVRYTSDYGNGDIDNDGDIDVSDYILVKRMCLRTYMPTYNELGYADVNMDSKVDVVDYILIKRHCLKTFDLFAVEEEIVD